MKTFFTLTLLALCINALAQKQGNDWCFGLGAGISFNSGQPVSIPNIAIQQDEGCTSIADSNGNLLFYTDGIYIWNKANTLMPNSVYLGGNTSSTQSALIVQQPGNDSLYYVFTTDAFEGVKGFEYSIVDMNLQGGMGDVGAVKNVKILSFSDERLTAVRNANGTDVWIIVTSSGADTIKAFTLTAAGLNTTPVQSPTGFQHIGTYPYIGYLKPSLDKKRLALAIDDPGEFDLFDFDNATGIASNPIALSNLNYSGAYGVEFSPDGSRLYGSVYTPPVIYQFNLEAGSPSDILNSATIVGTTTDDYIGALEAAPDGKIYVARYDSTHIGVINNPNTLGTQCDFVANGYLTNGTVQEGLPNIAYNLYLSPVAPNSVATLKNNNNFSIFPNPATGFITIAGNNIDVNTIYTITDITGKEILSGKLNSSNNNISLDELNAGIYLLKVEGNQQQTFKLMKE